MRRRNRKKNVQAFALSVPLTSFVVLVATLALGYVWLVCRCQSMGNELKELEVRRDALRKEHEQEVFKWTRMKSPQSLERALRDYRIDMTWPSSRQVVRLRPDDMRAPAAWDSAEETQIARVERSVK